MSQCPEEYTALKDILDRALAQASTGKGKERHASEGEQFTTQPICEISRRLGRGGPLFQAVKKIYESKGLPGPQAVQELLGAIVYTAAAIIIIEEQHQGLMTELASEVTGLKPKKYFTTSDQVLACPLCYGPMNAKDYQYYGKCFKCSNQSEPETKADTPSGTGKDMPNSVWREKGGYVMTRMGDTTRKEDK